jgi:hypothetical protein
MKVGNYTVEVDSSGDLWVRPEGYGDYHGANPIIMVSQAGATVRVWSDNQSEEFTHVVNIEKANLPKGPRCDRDLLDK